MPRVKKHHRTETGWSEWVAPVDGYRFICCDCGLSHSMEFLVVRVTSDPDRPVWEAATAPGSGRTLRVMFRARRNNRSTAQIRLAAARRAGGE